jgi:hypothetical protein
MLRVVKLAGIVATLLALLIPAYSQQEVDPTWYDPWTVVSKATVQHLQAERRADLARRRKIKSATGAPQVQKKPQAQESMERTPPQKVTARN